MQRAAHAAHFAFGVESIRDRQRVGIQLDNRVEFRTRLIHVLNTCEIRGRKLPRRERAGRHPRLKVVDRRLRKGKRLRCGGQPRRPPYEETQYYAAHHGASPNRSPILA